MNKRIKIIGNFTIILAIIAQIFVIPGNAFAGPDISKHIENNNFEEAYVILKDNLYNENKAINPVVLRQILEIENIVKDNSTMLLHAIELVDYAQDNKDYYNQMIGYYYLGSVYYDLYDDNKAIENFEKMLTIAQENDYDLGKGIYYMFMGMIYDSYEDYDLALENYIKAQPYFDKMKLDEDWIFPNFQKENKFLTDIISILVSKAEDKAHKIIDLSNIYKNENSELRRAVTSRCGYELNKINAFEEAIVLLKESKEIINRAKFGGMFNQFSRYLQYDLGYAYYNIGEFKEASEILLGDGYDADVKLQVERGELINQKLREIESKEIKRQSQAKTRVIIAISFLLGFLVITVALIIRQYRITDKLNQVIYEKSIRDTMTGLYNRTEIINIYEKNISNNISLAILDIDDFKNINDTYGHSIGDVVIKDIAKTIACIVGKSGDVGRYGGEEFLVIIYKDQDVDSKAILEKIRKEIEYKRWFFKETSVTVSIGLLLEAKDTSFSNGFKAADELLYLAKSKGKNIICDI